MYEKLSLTLGLRGQPGASVANQTKRKRLRPCGEESTPVPQCSREAEWPIPLCCLLRVSIGCATEEEPVRGRPIPEVLLTVFSPCLSLATAVGGVQMAEWVDSPEELGFSRGSLISELWCLAPLARHRAWGLFRRNELTVFVVSSRDG